jgi:membrane protease YdiL (CAAX protease family)
MDKYPSINQVLRLFGYIILLTILVIIPLEIINDQLFKLNESLIGLIAYSIPLLFASIRYLKRRKSINQDNYWIRKEKISLPVFLLIIGVLLLIIIVLDPLENILPVPDWFTELMSKMISKDIFGFITVAIMAPIFEELICRGIILDGFLKIYSPRKAILWSSLIFGIMHLNPWQFIGAFLGGLYLGWIYHRTQSIIPCIVIHAVNNTIAFLFISLCPDFTWSNLFGGNPWYYFSLVMIAEIFMLYGILILDKKMMIKPISSQIECSVSENDGKCGLTNSMDHP